MTSPENKTPPQGYKDKVQERVKEMVASLPEDKTPKKEKGVSSAEVRRCLWANELGDGILYRKINDGRFVYNNIAGEWMSWNGHTWQFDIMQGAPAAVENVVKRLLDETDNLHAQINRAMVKEDKDEADRLEKIRKTIYARVSRLRTVQGRNNCLKFSRECKDPLAMRGDELDKNPWLLGCANGVIDLKTGEFRPGRPDDMISMASPVEWQGINQPAPKWEKAILEIQNDDREMASYLQRLFGYAITGLSTEAVFPVLWGKGRNGKSLIVDVVSNVLGPLAGPIPSEMLLDQYKPRSASGPSPDIMQLKGMRIAVASETDEGRKFSASRVKWLTGGDELVGRNPHEKWTVTFKQTHTLFLLTNPKPQADGGDFAFWERLHLIPFKLAYVNRAPKAPNERRAILDLKEQILKEAAGVLAWLVRGCLLYQKHGLNPPEAIQKATLEYQKDEDLLGQFIDNCEKVFRHPTAKAGSSDLYDLFETWWEKNISSKPPKQKRFGTMMSKQFEKIKSEGRMVYQGIGIHDFA